MIKLKPNLFAAGIVSAAVMWLVFWVLSITHVHGGHIEDSPTGKYTLMILAPLKETVAGTYIVTLRSKATGNTLRSVTIKLNPNEKTRPVRGQAVSMKWDATEAYADIMVDGDFLTRISIPSNGS